VAVDEVAKDVESWEPVQLVDNNHCVLLRFHDASVISFIPCGVEGCQNFLARPTTLQPFWMPLFTYLHHASISTFLTSAIYYNLLSMSRGLQNEIPDISDPKPSRNVKISTCEAEIPTYETEYANLNIHFMENPIIHSNLPHVVMDDFMSVLNISCANLITSNLRKIRTLMPPFLMRARLPSRPLNAKAGPGRKPMLQK
jgi:hypothetical protein